MSPLERKIVERIRSEGPINFETFMEMALYYPDLGYYTRTSAQIGRAGDFYTSPHLHRIFGAMIGRQMEEMWHSMGCPECFPVVEMGAGMGYLAKDMLEYLKGKRIFPHLHYTIVELNPSIRERQRQLLTDLLDKISWRSHLSELDTFCGCLISNELLDAFPVRLVEMDGELMEIFVSYDQENGFREVKKPCSKELKDYFREFGIELPEGYKTEVNLKMRNWLDEAAGRLSEGFILTIDYGYPAWDYYSEDRSRGTLLCYYRHQINEDPFLNIGEQDLTAHINFSALKAWGELLGLKALGFGSQGTYLVSLGIDEVITGFYGEVPDPFEIAKIKGLIFPQGMGESHSVMVQHKGKGEIKLRGFDLRNQVKKL